MTDTSAFIRSYSGLTHQHSSVRTAVDVDAVSAINSPSKYKSQPKLDAQIVQENAGLINRSAKAAVEVRIDRGISPVFRPRSELRRSKRALAVEAGALDCDRNTFVAALRRIRESNVFGDIKAINQASRR